MLTGERRNIIMEMLESKGFIKITEIASRFEVSNETARRDLDYLQSQGLIHRTHGGAIPVNPESAVLKPSHVAFDPDVKAIAAAAADLVKPGETIFLGPGSTVLEVARCLKHRDNLIVLTNSLHVINVLADSNVTVFILGGLLNQGELDIVGDLANECLERFYCDKAIFGCGGVTLDHGVMDYSANGNRVQMPAIRRSAQHILVTGSHKFGLYAFLSACSLDDIHVIVSDVRMPMDYQTALRERGIRLILTKPSQSQAGEEF